MATAEWKEVDMMHIFPFLCQEATNLSTKYSIAWRCHQSDTAVTWKTWGSCSKERSVKELKEEAESLGWSVESSLLGSTMIRCIDSFLNLGFWYVVIAVSIGWFMVIPRRFLGSMSPNLDGCPPKKLAVWCDSWFVWDSSHFHGYCWECFSL